MFPTRLTLRFWILGLALAFFVAGVIFRVSAASDFAITSPENGAHLFGSDITFRFSIPANLSLVDYQGHPHPSFGQGHIHLWVDQTPRPDTAIQITSDTYTLTHLRYGSHTILAELVTNDHSSFTPPVTSSVTFTNSPLIPNQITQQISFNVLIMSFATFLTALIALTLVSYYRTHLSASTKATAPKKTSPRKKTK